MPLTITIPERELFDPNTNQFISVKEQRLTLEHSLISISKWESKWHKPYLSKEPKTEEETIDYLRCMCLNSSVDPKTFYAVDRNIIQAIAEYIGNPMTATTFKKEQKKPSREIITNELIYFWMTNFGIPFDPCERWHLNRLMTLIEVASIKSQPGKKMSPKDILRQNTALNAQRRAKMHSRG